MAPTTYRWLITLAVAFFAIAITGIGVFAGWVSDQSLLPFYGGGWRCYVGSVACIWIMALIAGMPIIVPIGSALFARWLTDKIWG